MSNSKKLSELFQDCTVTCPASGDGPEVTFTTVRTIGSGSFGVVFIAKTTTGETIAIKKVFQDRKYRNRELSIMQELGDHPFIIRLINSYLSVAATQMNGDYLNILMDYYPENGYQLYKSYLRAGMKMPLFQVKLYTFQFLRGLAYMHTFNIANRDLKPQNTLVNRETGRAVLCDLGSAKKLNPSEPNIAYICSRYYRAPELIFGSRYYTPVIDIWSFGCVVAEMIIGKPIYVGSSPLDQIIEIIKVLGPPSLRELKEMNPTLREYVFPNIKTTPMAEVLGTRDGVVLDFFAEVFKYSPKERITAYEALAHEFYDELRAPDAPIPRGLKLFEFGEYERQHIEPELLAKIVPKQ
ncbi:Kinase, CMGC GSK [Giardia muris]|uniref:Kinase, CMGC GSK n=1 Tax=Giardia muris TaxID=5742 RepID=A0A4Z1T6U8_GIAMU|nr:Kinase, CMGC GSK [Giardia muris]|eukprot:TNJ28269.1 Kinase, CMGC GSK [Giardia muris]